MSKRKNNYMYRPQQVYHNGLPLKKRIINRVERFNKILSLRVLGKLLRIKPQTTPLLLKDVNSILIIRYDALGDMIVTTPLWRILKRLKPSIKIGVAGSSKNLGLLREDSDIDVLYDYSAQSFSDFFRITKHSRQGNWDVVLMCKFNQKTRGALISRLSSPKGVTATIGSANTEGHQALFSRLISLPKPDKEMQMTEQLQFLLRSVIELPITEIERPSIMVSAKTEEETLNEINKILEQHKVSTYVVLNTDAPEVRKWGTENNIELAEYISTQHTDVITMITSLPENRKEWESTINKKELKRVQYFSTKDILELTILIRHSRLVITPDTGTAHIVSAEEKPIVGLYPEAGEWLPFDIPSYIIIPKPGEFINTIQVALVAKGVTTMLTEEPTNGKNTLRIVRCQDPDNIEFR